MPVLEQSDHIVRDQYCCLRMSQYLCRAAAAAYHAHANETKSSTCILNKYAIMLPTSARACSNDDESDDDENTIWKLLPPSLSPSLAFFAATSLATRKERNEGAYAINGRGTDGRPLLGPKID